MHVDPVLSLFGPAYRIRGSPDVANGGHYGVAGWWNVGLEELGDYFEMLRLV